MVDERFVAFASLILQLDLDFNSCPDTFRNYSTKHKTTGRFNNSNSSLHRERSDLRMKLLAR